MAKWNAMWTVDDFFSCSAGRARRQRARRAAASHGPSKLSLEPLEDRRMLDGGGIAVSDLEFASHPIVGYDYQLNAVLDSAAAGQSVRFYWDANGDASWDSADLLLGTGTVRDLGGEGFASCYVEAGQVSGLHAATTQTFFAFAGDEAPSSELIAADAVSFSASDSAPTVAGPTGPVAISYGQSVEFSSVNGNEFSISDAESGGAEILASIRVYNLQQFIGPLTSGSALIELGSTEGVEVTGGYFPFGLSEGYLQLRGTPGAITTALDGLQVTPQFPGGYPDGFSNGEFQVEVEAFYTLRQDGGATTVVQDSHSVDISVAAPVGAPVIDAPRQVSETETAPYTSYLFDAAMGTGVSLIDSPASPSYSVLLTVLDTRGVGSVQDAGIHFTSASQALLDTPGSGVVVTETYINTGGASGYKRIQFTTTLALANQLLEELELLVEENFSGALGVSVYDPEGFNVSQHVVVNPLGTNEAPILQFNESVILSADFDEDEPIVLGNELLPVQVDFYLDDPDFIRDEEQLSTAVTISTDTDGALTFLEPSQPWAFSIIEGRNGSSRITVIGDPGVITGALNRGLQFDPPPEYSGPVTLSFEITDMGNSGAGGQMSTSKSVTFMIDPVNDRPVITAPTDPINTRVNTTVEFSVANGNPIQISDVDAGASDLSVTLIVDDGAVTLSEPVTSGVQIVGGANGSSSVEIVGTVDELNAALEHLLVSTSVDFLGSTILTIEARDPFNSPSAQATATVPIRVKQFDEDFDVFLLLDDTGSFETELTSLIQDVPGLLNSLESAFGSLDFLGLGVGRIEDYGGDGTDISGGGADQRPFILNQPIVTLDTAGSQASYETAITDALQRTAPGGGADLPESTLEALQQVATGIGFDGNNNGNVTDSGVAGSLISQDPNSSGDVPAYSTFTAEGSVLPPAALVEDGDLGRGGAGFREGAIPIIVVATDNGTRYRPEAGGAEPAILSPSGASIPYSEFKENGEGEVPFNNGGSATSPLAEGARITDTIAALQALGAIVVGVGTNDAGRPMLEAISKATDAINSGSTPIQQTGPGAPIQIGDPLYFEFEAGAAGSFAAAIGDAIAAAVGLNATFYDDPLRVDQVTVRGSASAHPGYHFSDVAGSGEQLRTVPVGGADTIQIRFNQPVDPATLNGALTLTNLYDGPTSIAAPTPTYNSLTHTATWTFDLSAEEFDFFTILAAELTLSDTVTSLSGDTLDGEWTNPTSLLDPPDIMFSTFPSGDGEEGGDFVFRFGVLGADFDRDNDADGYNFLEWQRMYGTTPATFQDGDANGDNIVDGLDLDVWQSTFGTSYEWQDWVAAQLVAPLSVGAASILVSTATDELDGDYSLGDLSLREALLLAASLGGADEIVFRDTLQGQTISLDPALGELVIDSDVTISGLGAETLAISGGGQSRVFRVDAGVDADISGLTVRDGSAADGGGILVAGSLDLADSVVRDNSAIGTGASYTGYGGGIALVGGGLRIERTAVLNNDANYYGGGVAVDFSGAALVEIQSSTIADNEALFVGGMAFFGTPDVNVVNSTVSTNTAIAGAGGGIYVSGAAGSAAFINVTVTKNNGGGTAGAGIYLVSANAATLNNSIVAENIGGDDLSGSFGAASSYNLIGPGGAGGLTNPANNNLTLAAGQSAGLLPLADYGGPTYTHELLPSSPALNGGDNAAAAAAGLATDQRGQQRVIGGTVDIGAVELGGYSLPGVAPRVVSVEVSGSASTHAPYRFDEVVGSGEQLRTVPVGGADTVSISFSEDVEVEQHDMRLVGSRTGDAPSVASFSYDADTLTATWVYAAPLLADQYVIDLLDDVEDSDYDALDGEWVNPASLATVNAGLSTFPSGDGVAGGSFRFVFTNLPGDFDRDNVVTGADYLALQQGYGGPGRLFTDGDANGDGYVEGADTTLWGNNFGVNLLDVVLAADFDDNDSVNGGDYLIWQQHSGQSVTPGEDGDADGDGDVDSDDLDLLFEQYGISLDLLS